MERDWIIEHRRRSEELDAKMKDVSDKMTVSTNELVEALRCLNRVAISIKKGGEHE